MPEVAQYTLPPGISQEMLPQLLKGELGREVLLQGIIRRFEQRCGGSLEAFEARLARGEGPEHPDWEDSIEWRTAVESLQRTQMIRSLLQWLQHSTVPSPIS